MPSSIASTRAISPAPENLFSVIVSLLFFSWCGCSKCRGVGFAGADAHGVIEIDDEDLAVADLAGLRRRRDRVDDLVDLIRRAGDLELDLGQEAHGVFGAAVDFGVALLAAIAFDFGDGQPLHADFGQRVADLVELERLDDGHDYFHVTGLLSPTSAQSACCIAAVSRGTEFKRRASLGGVS